MYKPRAYKRQFTVCLCSPCALVQVEKLFWYLSWLFDCLQELKLPTTALAACLKGHLQNCVSWQPEEVHCMDSQGDFHSTKIPVWNFQWIVHFGCTDLTQATAHLFILLVIRIQKSITGDNNLFYFVKWERDISVKVHPLQGCPKNKNDPFHLISNKKLRLNGKHQGYALWIKTEFIRK